MMEIEKHQVFLEDVWAPVQTSDFCPSDDLPILAHDEIVSIKPEILADPQITLQENPLDGGSLEDDWMEQCQLLPCLDLWDDNGIFQCPSLPVQPEDENGLFPCSSLPVQPEDELDTSVSVDEFLQKVWKTPTRTTVSSEIKVITELDFSNGDGSRLEEMLDCEDVGFLKSPLSTDEVESVLSAACSPIPSETPSPQPSTVDWTENYTLSSDAFELIKLVKNPKTKETPYSRPSKTCKNGKSKGRKQSASIESVPSELELELMSKKDRKKLQNKNAAIRYRMKKKAESEVKKSEVDELESQNSLLQEKVDDLTRQINCMRGLINDVRKARGLAPATF